MISEVIINMNKIISFIIVFTILLSFPMYIQSKELPPVSDDLAALLSNQITLDEKDFIFNKANYSEELKDIIINDVPIVKIHKGFYCRWLFKNPNQSLSAAIPKINKGHFYVLFDTQNIILNVDEENGQPIINSGKALSSYHMPHTDSMFLADIRNMKRTMTILGEECRIEQVNCFHGCEFAYTETVVETVTDKGNFVTYYYHYKNQKFTLKEDDFYKLATDCYNYYLEALRISDGNYSGIPDIGSYYYGNILTLEDIKAQAAHEDEGISPWVWVAVVSGSVAVVGAAVLAAVLIPRRKKRKNSTA